MKTKINPLEELLSLYPKKPWNSFVCSRNNNVTWEIIQHNPDMRWNWEFISRNKHITWQIVLVNNPKISWNRTLDIVKKNADKDWNWSEISRNVSWQDFLDNRNNKECRWNWYDLSCNSNIRLEMVEHNPCVPWNERGLAYNVNVIWELILRDNPPLTTGETRLALEFVDSQQPEPSVICKIKCKGISINSFVLSDNPNVTWTYVHNQLNQYHVSNWNWHYLSKHPNITWQIVQKNQQFSWYWDALSQNPNITWEIVSNNPNFPWQYEHLSRNINIQLEDILEALWHGWVFECINSQVNVKVELMELGLHNIENCHWLL